MISVFLSYDFGETFCISDYEMRLLPRSVSHFLSLFQRRISLCDFNYPSLAKEFNIDPEYQKREILDVARRVMQITEDDISQLETELNTIFQPVIEMPENWEITDNICSIRHFVTEKYNFFTPLRCAYRPLKYSVIYS